jgi:predicted 2-oxoglutarate/Fe(II)-dependent dioxygenase YbiX
MIGLAFLANQLCWKYDLTHCDQSEFLMYEEHNNGKYDPHVDTLIGGQHAIDRKLTVLAFLSDPATYDGGRLFLRWSHER